MPTLRGTIYTALLPFTPAEWDDGRKTTARYPTGYEYVVTHLAWARDERTGERVFSPCRETEFHVCPDGAEHDNPDILRLSDDLLLDLGASRYALVDLVAHRHTEQLNDLIHACLVAREYTEQVDD